MNAADTSVVAAALASWHEGHAAASAAIAGGVRLPAHALLEAYSVLTRLPPPHRFAPGTARDLLRASFADETLTLDRAAHAALLDRLVEAGISGGASYDALIGVTASQHSATLFTRDPRAIRVYAALGVDFELVG